MKKDNFPLKKQPVQKRSVFMVDAIKQAAIRILKEQGLAGFNTNSVAELAGVSVGSLYQYFASKETLIAEIKRDHFDELRQLFKQASESLTSEKLEGVVVKFVDASVDAHRLDPELHRILSDELGNFEVVENDQSKDSLKNAIEATLYRYKAQLRDDLDIPSAAHLSYYLVEKTVHDTVINSKSPENTDKVIDELKIMLTSYLCKRGVNAEVK
ncbi:TetR/AcrR family transcriptional regulator [Paraglaciecola sp.]|uniref:TetR/AcrR family transcriptional regulator n=1 Tax=Paraglaciecola sp. TaxID=1920173 RepID=UPI0030F433A0